MEQSLLAMLSGLISLAAACASVFCLRACKSTSPAKRLRSLDVEIADLKSSMDELLESHKRLRSRIGMRELRDRRADTQTSTTETGAPPPPGASKAQLREFYGLKGKSHSDIARMIISKQQGASTNGK